MNNIKDFLHRNRSLLVLHCTVFIWGFTGLLGALISASAVCLVWYRVLIASIALLIWFIVNKTPLKLSLPSFFKLFFTGGILCAHWILFFYSIKVSTVSVTLVSLSSLTLFTSILDPLISRSKISKLEVIIGLLIITGICLIFKFESQYTLGIITGLVSALCASTFSIINSKQVKTVKPALISFYELASAWVWLNIYLLTSNGFTTEFILSFSDIIYLLVLGVICTAVAYVAGVSVMKDISAFRVALITNLEPIYGIILAFLIVGKKEEMSAGFYVGSIIILGSIFLFPYLKNRIK